MVEAQTAAIDPAVPRLWSLVQAFGQYLLLLSSMEREVLGLLFVSRGVATRYQTSPCECITTATDFSALTLHRHDCSPTKVTQPASARRRLHDAAAGSGLWRASKASTVRLGPHGDTDPQENTAGTRLRAAVPVALMRTPAAARGPAGTLRWRGACLQDGAQS